MVQWKHISEHRPKKKNDDVYLYRDVDGNYGVGVYETDDYFFDPGNGEVKVVWWAEFNLVEEESRGNVG